MLKIVDIGPECFTDGDRLVISYKGDNYYRSCGTVVLDSGLGSSSCVKRSGHQSKDHEDFFGNTREHVPGSDSAEEALTSQTGG